MKVFTDNASRTWSVIITVDSIRRVMKLLGINITEIDVGDPPLLVRLGTDEMLLCDIIYCLVKPQADELGVSDEDFGLGAWRRCDPRCPNGTLRGTRRFFPEARQTGQGQSGNRAEENDRTGDRECEDEARSDMPGSGDRKNLWWKLVHQCAGIVGVDPGPFSLRELMWMVESKDRGEWGRLSNLMALLANINRDPKKSKVFKPTDFNPYYAPKQDCVQVTRENIGVLREAFKGIK